MRQIIEGINEQIREANRKGVPGPVVMLRSFDVQRVLRDWHKRRHGQ